ncbi:MAG TPA: inositol monophosphatase family protein [Anaerolineae bacterium]|nr:inositol monophosphatase family protein [Anaerolineae bacterium]
MSDRLDFALHMARTGGQVLRERFLAPREIHAKGWRDFYTDADTAAQQTVVDLIRSHDPHVAIQAEEGLEPPPGATALWVIDPLDGTTNYARHFPVFSVSIAYVEQGQPQVGVVYDPLHDRTFFAEHERGAWLNADRLYAATTADIGSAIVALDWGRGEQQRAQALDWLARTGHECRTTRALGSAALGLSYLAAGWIDVYFHPMLAPWDGAAGQVIAEEAGARLFNFAGTRWNYTEPDCIACTSRLTEWARSSIR